MTDTASLTKGTSAPDFKLPASNDTEISLGDYKNRNNVYLFFVREFI